MPDKRFTFGFALLMVIASGQTHAQVDVNEDDIIGVSDFLKGRFNGQDFVLGPGTIFNINFGGLVWEIGDERGEDAFDFLGSTMNVNNGGELRGYSSYSNINLNLFDGATVGPEFTVLDSEVLIDGGDSSGVFRVWDNSSLTMTSGNMERITVRRGSSANISGGFIRDLIIGSVGVTTTTSMSSDAVVNSVGVFASGEFEMTGGLVRDSFEVGQSSSARISGGAFSSEFQAKAGSDVTLVGTDFKLDGASINSIGDGLGEGQLFTGTFADGGSFIFWNDGSRNRTDIFAAGSTTLENQAVAPADTTPMVVTTGQGPSLGLREGQALTIGGDAMLREHYSVVGATLNIEGGTIGYGLETAYSNINISGGQFGANALTTPTVAMSLYDGSVASISGGDIPDIDAYAGSTISITGGDIDNVRAKYGSNVEITGGEIWGSTEILGTAEISGGTLGVASTRGIDIGPINPSQDGGGILYFFGDAVTDRIDINEDSQLIMSGGIAEEVSNFRANGGPSFVSLSGGLIRESFGTSNQGFAHISGGRFGFLSQSGEQVVFEGAEFMLNGIATLDLSSGVNDGASSGNSDLLTGTLADGSVFIISGQRSERVKAGIATLDQVVLDPIDTTPRVISSGEITKGFRSGEQVTITSGATVGENVASVGASLTIDGATVANGFESAYSDIHINDGTLGTFFAHEGSIITLNGGMIADRSAAYAGSIFKVEGGTIGERFTMYDQSMINLSSGLIEGQATAESGSMFTMTGGGLGGGFVAEDGSNVRIEGGVVGDFFSAESGSTLEVTGGQFGDRFDSSSRAMTTISGGAFGREFEISNGSFNQSRLVGGEFKLNGTEITNIDASLSNDYLFTGTFADGSVFLFSDLGEDLISQFSGSNNLLEVVELDPINTNPIVISADIDRFKGLRRGQSLTLGNGADIQFGFASVQGAIEVTNGSIGVNLEILDTTLVVNNGSIGDDLHVYGESDVLIRGMVGEGFRLTGTSDLVIQGGSVGSGLAAYDGTSVTLESGSIGRFFSVTGSVPITITGGTIASNFRARGAEVLLDGGAIGDHAEFTDGSSLVMHSGSIGDRLNIEESTALIEGGSIGDEFQVEYGSDVLIAGGTVSEVFGISWGQVRLHVLDASIDGQAIALINGVETEITQRGGAVLAATLLDGSAFQFVLNDSFTNNSSWIIGGTLSITLVPAPASVVMLGVGGLLAARRRRS